MRSADAQPFSLSNILAKAKITGFINDDTVSDLTITDLPTQVNATSAIPYTITVTAPDYYTIDIDTTSAKLTINKKKITIKPIQYPSTTYTGNEYDSYDTILENNYPLIYAAGLNYVQTGEFLESAPEFIITYRIYDPSLHVIVDYDGTNYTKPYDSKEPWRQGTYTIQAISAIDPSTKDSVSFSTNYNVQLSSSSFNIGSADLAITTKKVTYDGTNKTPNDFITIGKFNGSDVKVYGLKFMGDIDSVVNAGNYTIDFSNATYSIVSNIDYSETPFVFDHVTINGGALGSQYNVTLSKATLSLRPSNYEKTYDALSIEFRQDGIYNATNGNLLSNSYIANGLVPGQVVTNIKFESEDIQYNAQMVNSDTLMYRIMSDGVTVMNGLEDVTSNYTINYQYGIISIKPIKLIVRTLSSNEYYSYDGTYHKGNTIINLISGSLMGTDSLTLDPSYEGYKNAGTYRAECVMIIGNEDNYTVEIDKTYQIFIEKVDLYIDYSNVSSPVITGLIGSDYYSSDDSLIKGSFGSGMSTFATVKFTTVIYDSSEDYVSNCYNIYYIYNGYQKAPDGTVTKIS